MRERERREIEKKLEENRFFLYISVLKTAVTVSQCHREEY